VLRVVCRNGFSPDLAENFLADLRAAVARLDADTHTPTTSEPAGFHH